MLFLSALLITAERIYKCTPYFLIEIPKEKSTTKQETKKPDTRKPTLSVKICVKSNENGTMHQLCIVELAIVSHILTYALDNKYEIHQQTVLYRDITTYCLSMLSIMICTSIPPILCSMIMHLQTDFRRIVNHSISFNFWRQFHYTIKFNCSNEIGKNYRAGKGNSS